MFFYLTLPLHKWVVRSKSWIITRWRTLRSVLFCSILLCSIQSHLIEYQVKCTQMINNICKLLWSVLFFILRQYHLFSKHNFVIDLMWNLFFSFKFNFFQKPHMIHSKACCIFLTIFKIFVLSRSNPLVTTFREWLEY